MIFLSMWVPILALYDPRQRGSWSQFIAFEPDPDAWEWLCKNIDLNGVAVHG